MRATTYKSIDVDGLSIFYREAGSSNAPNLLLLHGFPSSSRMYEPLFTPLADAFLWSLPTIQDLATTTRQIRQSSTTPSITLLASSNASPRSLVTTTTTSLCRTTGDL